MTFYGSIIAAFFSTCWLAVRYRMGMVWAPKAETLPRSGLGQLPLVGGVFHGARYLWTFPQGLLKYLDVALPLVSLAHAFGRLGCFLAGCCFGSVTDHPAGLRFPGGSPAYQLHRKEHLHELMGQYRELGEHLSLPVHPTQLYSVASNLLIFGVLWFWVRKRKQFHGQVAATMLVMYGISRFAVEFFRADYRGEFFGLSTSQWISLPLILLALYGLWKGFESSTGLMDDGADPPLGKPLTETVLRPHHATWDGQQVSPTATWREDAAAFVERLRHGKGSGENTQAPPQPSSVSDAASVSTDVPEGTGSGEDSGSDG
ncbi:MAG: prolipoprotein diacylglyceryl transferase family protein, partial [Myxococcota bacterium]